MDLVAVILNNNENDLDQFFFRQWNEKMSIVRTFFELRFSFFAPS